LSKKHSDCGTFFCYHTDAALLFSGVFGSTPTRMAGALDFTAIAGKRQGCEVPGLENPIETKGLTFKFYLLKLPLRCCGI
jgi:hypothetical protein